MILEEELEEEKIYIADYQFISSSKIRANKIF